MRDFVFNDLSLSEIAGGRDYQTGRGRYDQTLWKELSDYEKKLHLVEKFLSVKEDVEENSQTGKQFF